MTAGRRRAGDAGARRLSDAAASPDCGAADERCESSERRDAEEIGFCRGAASASLPRAGSCEGAGWGGTALARPAPDLFSRRRDPAHSVVGGSASALATLVRRGRPAAAARPHRPLGDAAGPHRPPALPRWPESPRGARPPVGISPPRQAEQGGAVLPRPAPDAAGIRHPRRALPFAHPHDAPSRPLSRLLRTSCRAASRVARRLAPRIPPDVALQRRLQHPQRADRRPRQVALLQRLAKGGQNGPCRGGDQVMVRLGAPTALHIPAPEQQSAAILVYASVSAARETKRRGTRESTRATCIGATIRLFSDRGLAPTIRIGGKFLHFG